MPEAMKAAPAVRTRAVVVRARDLVVRARVPAAPARDPAAQTRVPAVIPPLMTTTKRERAATKTRKSPRYVYGTV